MKDKRLEEITADDATAYMMTRPRTAFGFGLGRDKEPRTKLDTLTTKQLRERILAAVDMPRGNDRDVEIRRLYRILAERECFADMPHVGTQERTVIRWAFKDAYTR
jgi:hypothetical protein